MKKQNSSECLKYFFVVFVLALIYVIFLIVKPFISALLTAAVLAYFFYPVYDFLLQKTGRKNVSAFIVSVIIIVLITVPSAYIFNQAAQESEYLYIRGKQKLITGDILGAGCSGKDSTICSISTAFSDYLTKPKVRYHLEEAMKKMSGFFADQASDFIFAIPFIVLSIFITFFVMFYLFKDGKALVEKTAVMLPIRESHKKRIISRLSEMTFAVIYGTILVAFIQGVVGLFGYYIFGVPSALMLGMLTVIAALLPFVGTILVWLPVSVSIILMGLGTGNNATVWAGIGLMIYGALIISSVDNILKPYIIGKKSGMHPVLVLIGALGGIYLFGFIGFVAGPIILELFIVVLDIYKEEKDGKKCFA